MQKAPVSTKKKTFVKKTFVKKSKANGFANATSVLKSTEKAANSALLVEERCNAWHGRTIQEVLDAIRRRETTYRLADLRYDLKRGRLLELRPGSKAGPLPVGKTRKAAPCAGQPLPAASVDEFFQFMQCQLRFEAKHHTNVDVKLTDKIAETMYPQVEAFVTPNLGATERWVPYHTILGVHELFLAQSVHSRRDWSEKQRFLAIFVFRAHCKRDLFTQAQLPLMLKSSFWKHPIKAFMPGGPMEAAILKYRKKTNKPLITSCFRIIPERILKDDDANLVRSITNRTMGLLQVAEFAYPIMKDKKKSPKDKLNEISALLQNTYGLGETWAKMITCCLDLAYPSDKLLESQCDVGSGAITPLRCLLPKSPEDKRAALSALLKVMNTSKSASSKNFWAVLTQVEKAVRSQFSKDRLVCAQANTKQGRMTAVTLQVQLCEYRQFRHSVARHMYGLADDETMRVEPEKEGRRRRAEDYCEVDQKRKCVYFDFLTFDEKPTKIHFEVPLKSAGNSEAVARRVGALCLLKLRYGEMLSEVEKLRDDLLSGYHGGEDVPLDHVAWDICRTYPSEKYPPVSFYVEFEDGRKIPLQTTTQAAGGNILEAERIARLCYVKMEKGFSKDAVIEYRNQLYKKLPQNKKRPLVLPGSNHPPAKRRAA
jgi:hypothetical protein